MIVSNSGLSTGSVRGYRSFARSVGIVSMAGGTLVLLGWAFDVGLFKSVLPELEPMKPNTAVCFILAGAGLYLSLKKPAETGRKNSNRPVVAQTCALMAVLIGTVTLGEHLFGFRAGLDSLLFREALLGTKAPFPGRMAQVTALEFVILGIALVLLNAQASRGQRLSQYLALAGMVIGLLVLLGYAYNAKALYQVGGFSAALSSAMLFVLLSSALLCAQPDHGLMSTLTSPNLGGSLARRIFPVALTLPFLLGWLRLQGQYAGLYGTEFGLAIFTTANVLTFAGLVWFGSRSLNKADAEHQRAAVRLEEANERLRARARVLDLAQVLVCDMESRIVEWNLGAERLYGFRREEALGRISHELFHTQFPQPLAQIEESLRRSGSWEGELVHRKRDGTRLVVASQWVLDRDSAGCAARILETNTDITDRAKTEQVLQESEERFRTMADSIPQLAWIAQADGYVFWYNRRWYEYTGTTPAQMEGWGWQSVHDPNLLPEVLEQWRASIATGNPFEMEFPLRRADGDFRRFLTRVLPLKDAEGRVAQWFGTNTDINEQKRAEDEIRRLNTALEGRVIERTAQLQASNVELRTEIAEREKVERAFSDKNLELQNAAAAKDRFLANMSHELRTPLNGIIGFAEFLADGKPGGINPKQKEFLEDILNNGRHLLALISDLLDLTKTGAGAMEFNPQSFSLRAAIEEVCVAARPIAQKKKIQILLHLGLEIDDVTLDQHKFKQVLSNLLSNAIKFNREGGKVKIRTEPHEADRVKLVVMDTGVGIEAEHLGRIFKEFEQLDAGTSRHYEGTGLGLALTRKIVELQGGTIGVESEFGQGSIFTVVLPSSREVSPAGT